MAVPRAGREVTGAGFALTGISVWAVAAVELTAAHPEIAFLGVIFGGVLAIAGLALSFAPARRVGTPISTRRVAAVVPGLDDTVITPPKRPHRPWPDRVWVRSLNQCPFVGEISGGTSFLYSAAIAVAAIIRGALLYRGDFTITDK